MKRRLFSLLVMLCATIGMAYAQQVIKVGIIGLDTSHAPAFIGMMNSENPKPEFAGFRVVAAYPYGSRTIESSMKRIPGYIDKAKEQGVEIVQSIADLLKKVDCVMLETNDGNVHLEQAMEVLKSGKPLFVDKPVAATLTQAIALFMLAESYQVPVFSSSALRYVPQNQDLRNGKFGKVIGADCCSPAPGEPSHPDFSWYGIHGVETLFTVMGTGCRQVSRMSAEGTDVVTGLWEDGRIGTFRGIRQGKDAYGGTAYCSSGKVPVGEYSGYECLLVEIAQFFRTKVAPISADETIEIFTFMEASNESKRQGGCLVSMQDTYDKARREAELLVGNIRLITLDPGHFHAALVQKEALEGVDSTVFVYAPSGQDLTAHLQRIASFNTRTNHPTHWNEKVYQGADFLEKMLAEKPGHVVILAGNNRNKTDQILQAVSAGFHVLADKPMAIDKASFAKLEESFRVAEQKQVKLYDIMTERYDVWTEIQRILMQNPELFGSLVDGSEREPAVTVSSTHHFYKVVAGSPLIRPLWYYDVGQQGEGLVDVTTHLVDLIHWKCFPEQVVDYTTDIQLLDAKHWPTKLTNAQFALSTGVADYPDFLLPYVQDSVLNVYANGSMRYRAKGKYIDLRVIWDFQAPKGTGDTHVCIIRGTNATVSILQGAEQGFAPKLYIAPNAGVGRDAYRKALGKAVDALQATYPGVSLRAEKGRWEIVVPKKLQSGHEQHFSSVIRKYIGYLNREEMPAWEVPNMLTKYYLTTSALEKARQAK